MMNDVYALSFSDHNLIGFNSRQNRVKTAPKTIRCRNYRRYDRNKLKDDLKIADWSPVYISHSISDSLQAFNRILSEFFDRHAPFATKRTNTNWTTGMYYDEISASRKQPKTTRNTNVRETKLIT